MSRLIKNQVLSSFVAGLAIPLVIGGCTTLPEQQQPVAPSIEVTGAPAVVSKTAPAPASVKTVPKATHYYEEYGHLAPAPTAPLVVEPVAPPAAEAAAVIPDDSIWARIRAGLRMEKLDPSLTQPHERWFVENAEFRENMFERSKLYLYYIVEEVEKRGMPMEIALLPAIESAYKPYAYSRAKASGLWQFIPSTGKLYGLKTTGWYDGRRDVIASTRAALDYLQKLYEDFHDWQLALAAYNAGEGRIGRAMEDNRRKGKPTEYVHLKQLKLETRHYVPKLMAMVNIVSDPSKFGIELPDIPNEPYFARVETDSQVDLGVVARLTGMEANHLHHINPGYTRWTTDPAGPHHVLVPAHKKEALVAGLSSLPAGERVKWRHHQVSKGDTLHSIARQYQITVETIKDANKLTGAVQIGQNLLLPISDSAALAAKPSNTITKPVRAAAAKPKGGPLVHQVRAGETLWSIARRYNVLLHQLQEWNSMKPGEVLRYGQKLKVFTHDGPSASHRDLNAVRSS